MSALSDPRPGEQIEVRDPRTGDLLYGFEEATDAIIDAAFARARSAASQIASMTIEQRVEHLVNLQQYILTERESILDDLERETGKARTDGLVIEILMILDAIQYYRKHAKSILRDERVATPPAMWPKKSRIFYEPLGVVLVIAPWNYPLNLSFIPFICAFLAGNAVVLKPSEYTPLKGLYERLCKQSGLPDGAFSAIYGGKDVGRRAIERRPDKICFTGSVAGGKAVMAQAAQYLIPVELELGGKDPMIVFDDANLERAANGALWGGMANCGQTCTGVERIYVQRKLFEPFTRLLAEKIAKLRLYRDVPRPGESAQYDLGAMTTGFQLEKVAAQIDQALTAGAAALVGGRRSDNSRMVEPTLLIHVSPDMSIEREETFGPVVTATPFDSEDDAVQLANDSPYGLSASVWSHDMARAERVARRLKVGGVSINNVLTTAGNIALPFGGIKDSGIGRYKGAYGLRAFTNIKSVMLESDGPAAEWNWYPYTIEKYRVLSKLAEALYGSRPFGLLKAAFISLRLKALAKRQGQ